MKTLIKNVRVINEGSCFVADILINDKIIQKISEDKIDISNIDLVIDASGLWLLPGIIDDQVHFREPGLTNKADIYSETRAAAAGGITSFMDMPNTKPPTISNELLKEKLEIAAKKSHINYSFFLGTTNDNLNEIISLDPTDVAGVKMFLGSSTGNMLVDKRESIEKILQNSPILVAAHCEDDGIIKVNLLKCQAKYGDDIPIYLHSEIRSVDACYSSSSLAVEIAQKTGGRLHIFHLSTEKEIGLLSNESIKNKRITAEVCVHHLWFNENDYKRLGTKIKWNPSIKKESDRLALIQALKDGKIDVVATDHAPHTLQEKDNNYVNAPSGAPLVQHSLIAMIDLMYQGYFTIEEIVKWMCHNPAELFQIEKRGYIRENYFADLVLVEPNGKTLVTKENILYKCGWSPFEGHEFNSSIKTTFVNGQIVYDNGKIIDNKSAMKIKFNR